MKKIFLLVLIITLCLSSKPAYAKYIIDDSGNIVLSQDCYNVDGKIIINSKQYEDIRDLVRNAEINIIDWTIPKLTFLGPDSNAVSGTMSYPNYNDQVLGSFDLQWIFTPDDPKYETRSGVFHLYLWPPDTDAQKGKMPDSETTEEPTAPSLTASSVSLNTMTAYDINLDNKVIGSTYLWTSSAPEVVEVNSKSGLLKAKAEGKADVTCKVTLPDATTQTLISEVTVGIDENAPLLTETQLDLNPGDAFDINLENKVAKSKYRWVSSDRSIVTINSSNGIVAAKAAGTAYITCTITTPDKQVIVHRCDINVTAPAVTTE